MRFVTAPELVMELPNLFFDLHLTAPDLREYLSDNHLRERLGAVRKPHLPDLEDHQIDANRAVRKPHLPDLEDPLN